MVPNSVGWYILEGYPWWPVYICDVFKLRPHLHILGSGHRKILKKARDFPDDFIVVYYFGSHDFSLVGRKKGVLRPWDCAQKDQFLKGHPKHLTKKKGTMDELLGAVHEAEEYLSQSEDIRLPPHMVPSDLDPTLEPPPPELVPPELVPDQDVDEKDEDDDAADDEKVQKKKKDKKQKQKKETKRKSDGKGSHSSLKVTKTVDTDVKRHDGAKNLDKPDKPTVDRKAPPTHLSTAALSLVLEKEIRWILVNCPFEEMTTKTVRKLLEKRLNMDLRHEKASIKAGVARVIASMEDEDAVASTSPVTEKDAGAVEAPAMATTALHARANQDVELDARDEVGDTTREVLERASTHLSLALELESKILDVLESLETVDTVDQHVLATSTLQPKLVRLRAHRSAAIATRVTELVTKWHVEDVVPGPQAITKDTMDAWKATLETATTPHDELVRCLHRLSEMPLTMEHLKKSGLPRAVSKLRQHGNDKVSAKAHELRQQWIQQSHDQSDDLDAGAASFKTVQTLTRVLDQPSDDVHVQTQQLAALDQLYSMALHTHEIIDSKVGISVSKLRKSSNENVAKAAKRLRKKWQAQAKETPAA